ncbi:MAG: hypothetical protein GX968_09085 [Tissierellia bacterium]|nr:hypothetical protein [Tissierellia bacterium]
MSYTNEDIRLSSELFFHLLNNRILANTDILATLYYDNNEIKEIVENMAEEAGLRIISTRENLHLVSKGEDSIFATNYTQMKEKYNKLERKKHFYLANVIICIYLAEIDRENDFSFRIEDSGISYYKLEEIISNILDSWKKRNEEEESFSKDFAIAIEEIHHLWTMEMSHSKEGADGTGFSTSSKTRLGFIHEALKPLDDEGLIIRLQRENRIIPREELYERLNILYHGGDRYEEIMELIKTTKEEENGQIIEN